MPFRRPYKRRKRFGRRFYKRRRFNRYRRGLSNRRIYKAIKRYSRKRTELLSNNWTYSWINLVDTENINSFTICPFIKDVNDYTKNSIYVYSLRIRLLYPDTPFVTSWKAVNDDYVLYPPRARFIFFQWFEQQNPTISDILDDSGSAQDAYLSGYKRHPTHKAVILKDFCVSPQCHTIPSTVSNSNVVFSGNKPIKLLFKKFKHRWYINPVNKDTQQSQLIGRIYMAMIRLHKNTLYKNNTKIWARLNYTDID